jgi:hypothetical protein
MLNVPAAKTTNIITLIKASKMTCAEHISHMGKKLKIIQRSGGKM